MLKIRNMIRISSKDLVLLVLCVSMACLTPTVKCLHAKSCELFNSEQSEVPECGCFCAVANENERSCSHKANPSFNDYNSANDSKWLCDGRCWTQAICCRKLTIITGGRFEFEMEAEYAAIRNEEEVPANNGASDIEDKNARRTQKKVSFGDTESKAAVVVSSDGAERNEQAVQKTGGNLDDQKVPECRSAANSLRESQALVRLFIITILPFLIRRKY